MCIPTAQAYENSQYPQAEKVLSEYVREVPGQHLRAWYSHPGSKSFRPGGRNRNKALLVLDRHRSDAVSGHADFQLALAKAELLAGRTDEAQHLFEHVYLGYPLSIEAGVARAQLASSGTLDTIPATERRRHADALYGAGHYADAAVEYRSLAGESGVPPAVQGELLVAAAECDWKLKRLTKGELARFPTRTTKQAPAACTS